MPQQKRSRLWPAALVAGPSPDIEGFLQAQARDLERLVKGAFKVAVEKRVVESVFIYNFTVILPQLDYWYQLFTIRLIGDDFPARVEAMHLPEARQITPVGNQTELEQCLKDLFHDPRTAKIVRSLASDGRAPRRDPLAASVA